MNLGSLQPKLWVALAAPVKGTEFDPRTLELLDTDHDGAIRVPEVVAAAAWAGHMLRDRSPLARADGLVPLAAIDDSHAEGRHLKASARRILDAAGKTDATVIGPADVQDVGATYAGMRCNGDGLVPAEFAERPDDAAAIEAIVATLGGEPDRGGQTGVDAARIERFFDDAAACLAWHAQGEADSAVRALGAQTGRAAEAFRAVRAKVDDHFTRACLAAFDPRAAGPLSVPEATDAGLGSALLAPTRADVEALSLAAVAPNGALPLRTGLNPAWQAAIGALADEVVAPVLGAREALTLDEWLRICRTFDAHEAWMAARPDTPVATLGVSALQAHADPERRARLLALVALDAAAAPGADGIAGVERLAHYCRGLLPFARNFVSFSEFYSGGRGVLRFIGDQIRNFANARGESADAHLTAGVEANVPAPPTAPEARPPAPGGPVDMGRSVGIFAAIALALGALGTALTAIVTGFLGLAPTQMPLVVLGLLLLISGP